VDTHIAAQWNVRVYRDKAVFACDPRAHSQQEIAMAGERPLGMIYVTGYDRAAGTAQLMMESGKLYDIGCASQQAFLRPAQAQLDQVYKTVYRVGGLTLGLTSDGFLREIQGASSRPFSLGALDGTIHELAPNQSIEFFGEK
jgi:hypothetical protein